MRFQVETITINSMGGHTRTREIVDEQVMLHRLAYRLEQPNKGNLISFSIHAVHEILDMSDPHTAAWCAGNV